MQYVLNYTRIENAIKFIEANFSAQPTMEDIAAAVHMSPQHLQKLFLDFAGTTPKKYVQYLTLNYAKFLLREEKENLFNTSEKVGFSSTSRLHDLFVQLEGMTPAVFQNYAKDTAIYYATAETKFGNLLIANTDLAICYMAFYEDETLALPLMNMYFANAQFENKRHTLQKNVIDFINENIVPEQKIKLHVKGTPFQLKVWQALLEIPLGAVNTYGNIANRIGQSGASRAVGTAIGSNPITFIIPCHRVIQGSGLTGGYMWGPMRKKAILGWEAAQLNQDF